jgi:hypothetical protein
MREGGLRSISLSTRSLLLKRMLATSLRWKASSNWRQQKLPGVRTTVLLAGRIPQTDWASLLFSQVLATIAKASSANLSGLFETISTQTSRFTADLLLRLQQERNTKSAMAWWHFETGL